MYHALLANRYLTTRAIPLIAIGAVALCVALVIIVVSVMSGFLEMVRSSGKTLVGDVIISQPISGIPHYPDLVARLEALPQVAAATPVVESWGLIKMPYPVGDNKQIQTVQIWGIEPESFAAVTGFADTLYWKPLTDEQEITARPDDFRRGVDAAVWEHGKTLRTADGREGIALGIHISKANERKGDGSYEPMSRGDWWMPGLQVTVTTMPIGSEGGLGDPESFIFPVVNEFASGVFLIDNSRVMIPIDRAQKMMQLDESEIVDPDDFEKVLGVDPARATMILVRAAAGTTADELREIINTTYDTFVLDKVRDPEVLVWPRNRILPGRTGVVAIQTWEQQQAGLIGPIEKERELMRVLFSIIYLVCAGLILAIFWSIVYEKTRDIGILRSIGASRIGITWIFLRYGLFVGVLGSLVGLMIAWIVVSNINAIHTAMGEKVPRWVWITAYVGAGTCMLLVVVRSRSGLLLPVVLWVLASIAVLGLAIGLMYHQGTLIWDPKVYYFTRVPSQMDPVAAVTTMFGAIVFSLIGALIPAARAADTDPVKALRYE